MKHRDPQLVQFLTATELAQRWKVTTHSLRRWRKAGRLKAAFIGRGIRFTMSEIERFEREAEA